MKRRTVIFCLMTGLLLFTACRNTPEAGSEPEAASSEESVEDGDMESLDNTEQTMGSETSVKEKDAMRTIEIIVGDKAFSAVIYDNEAASALTERLPMTLNMSELNNNEKYAYLSGELPTDASRPADIRTGDLMLYGRNCLVLFYESFQTNYSYTSLGHIENPEGLAAALGTGSVYVTFQ